MFKAANHLFRYDDDDDNDDDDDDDDIDDDDNLYALVFIVILYLSSLFTILYFHKLKSCI